MFKVLTVIIIWCIAELIFLVRFAHVAGVLTTLLILAVVGVIGALLAKRQGAAAVERLRNDLNNGKVPALSVMNTVLIFTAGVLLILPGFFSDIVAIALLIPPVRRLIAPELLKVAQRTMTRRFAGGHATFSSTTFSTNHSNPTTGFGRTSARHYDDVIDLDGEEVDIDTPIGEIEKGSGT